VACGATVAKRKPLTSPARRRWRHVCEQRRVGDLGIADDAGFVDFFVSESDVGNTYCFCIGSSALAISANFTRSCAASCSSARQCVARGDPNFTELLALT
jgi:hypothetical protein